MEPIRILQVFASLDRGGAEAMIMNIYRNINREKVQFDFVVNKQSEEYFYESEIKKLGGRIYHIPSYRISNHFKYRNEWKQLISEHPEWLIIHAHHTSTAFIYLRVAKSYNRLTIAHSHTAGGEIKLKSRLKVLMRYPLRYIADYLVACSNSAAKWMFGKHSKHAYIINNAINTADFIYNEEKRIQKRNKFNIENKFVIGHIGRFDSAKNQDFLIDIFNEIHNKNSNSVLMLVGDGELRKSIEKKVDHLGLTDCVIFTGVRSDVSDLLQVMDVFVFPSLFEGLPVTIIEAQAAGLPCIISNTITDEVVITDLVTKIDLSKSPEYWADKALKYSINNIRKNTYLDIVNSGYEIKQSAKMLEDLYLCQKL